MQLGSTQNYSTQTHNNAMLITHSTLKRGLNGQGEGGVVKSLSKGGISFKKEGESAKKKATFHDNNE